MSEHVNGDTVSLARALEPGNPESLRVAILCYGVTCPSNLLRTSLFASSLACRSEIQRAFEWRTVATRSMFRHDRVRRAVKLNVTALCRFYRRANDSYLKH